MKDEYDKTAERIHALDMPMESYQVGTNKIAALLREAFPEHAQAAPSEELVNYYEQVAKEEYPDEDKPEGWPSWRAKAEEMERNWHGATETHIQERRRADELEAALASERLARNISETLLRNLLAIVHRDGGHHTAEVGLAQSTTEAQEIVALERAKREGEIACGAQTLDDLRGLLECSADGQCGIALDYEEVEMLLGAWPSPAPDAAALREALRVCGNCKHGQPTSLDDTRCYKATPYVPVERWAKACADWSAAPTRDNPRDALLRSEPQGEEGRGS